MAKKRRRKDRAEPTEHTREGSPAGRNDRQTVQPPAAAGRKGEDSNLPPEQNFNSLPSPEPDDEPEGIFDRITRWFTGPGVPAYSPGPSPPPPPQRPPEPVQAKPEPEPPPPPARREPPSPPPSRPAASGQSSTTPASKVDHILAVLTLERVLPELDAARKQLEEMRVSSDQRIRQLEAERDQLRAEMKRASAGESGGADTIESARRLQEELDEARKTAEARIRQLEAERDQSRSETDRALALQDELNHRIRELESSLEARKSDRPAEEVTSLESRVQTLEEELNAARSQAQQEREEAQARLDTLESERSEMEASLAAKEKKLMASLAQIAEVHEQARQLEEEMARLRNVESERDQLSTQLTAKAQELLSVSQQAERVQKLEAELTEWKNRATTRTDGRPDASKESAPAAAGAAGTDAARLSDLYQQTTARLTVIQASAELLAMNSRLDASSRETAQEIRNASQLLSEIIKNFTLPSDRRKAE